MTRRTSRKLRSNRRRSATTSKASKPKKIKFHWPPANDYDTRVAYGLPVHGGKSRRTSRRRSSLRRNAGNPLKGLDEALIYDIKVMTERNAHSQAVLRLAYAVGLPGAIKHAREILAKHTHLRYLPHSDVEKLNTLRNALLAVVKSRTNADFYERLHRAF